MYYETFEKRGQSAAVNGLAFFFGLAFIIEVLLVVVFGVDQRSAEAGYIGGSLKLGEFRIPFRLVVAFGVALVLTAGLTAYLSRTFTGRAIKAVGQDEAALRLMGADPVRIKQIAFGIATGVNALAGAMLIIVTPLSLRWTEFISAEPLRGCACWTWQHERNTGGRDHSRYCRIHRFDVFRRIVGAGGCLRLLLAVLAFRPKGLFGR